MAAPRLPMLATLAAVLVACATPAAPPSPRHHLGAVLGDSAAATTLEPAAGGRSESDRSQAQALVDAAAERRTHGDFFGAETAAAEALRLDPGLAAGHAEWALAAEALGRPVELVAAHYSLGARLAPDDARAQLVEAAWHVRSGDGGRALEAIDRALRAEPKNAEALTRKGDVVLSQGAAAAALSYYQAALALEPNRVPALVGMADAAERAGDLAAAEAALRALIGELPEATLYRSRLIAFLRRSGQVARADAEQRLLDAKEPKDARKLRKLRR
ncbi:MAG: tetratricopeptide repeat protein [Deltaproteobacteria bacterium]|nr:tetratricopeptide repeat protein [Deltaproteobacteria bacterium]